MNGPDIRVLHVSEILPGGTATYLQELWPFQRERLGGTQVRFLLPAAQLGHVPELPAEIVTGWDRQGRNPTSLIRLGTAIVREAAQFKPDIIHLHGTFGGLVGRIALAANRNRPLIVYCSHGWSFAMETSPAKQKVYSTIERALSPMADSIIAISDDERRLAIEAGLPKDKIVSIPNGISTERLGHDVDRPQAGPLRLLFVGRHDRQKGLDILLDAMTRVRDVPVQLDVIGEKLGADGRPVAADATKAGAADENVTYIGWVSRQEVARRMAAADALIVPSRWEGFGLVAIEAMREGTPVIASDRGALPEVVTDGQTGLIFSLTPDAIAACIRQLSREQLRVFGVNARSDFEKRFSSRRMNEDILSLYSRLVTGPALSRKGAQPHLNHSSS